MALLAGPPAVIDHRPPLSP